jgi:membrane protease YdiL (CAAX protease family)
MCWQSDLSQRRRGGYASLENVLPQASTLTILTPFSFFVWAIAIVGLLYFATFPDLRATADTGIVIGIAGLVGGVFISYLFGDYFGKLEPRVLPFSVKQDANYAIATGILALISLLAQFAIGIYAGTQTVQSTVAAPTDPIAAEAFVEFMAIVESWFFVFFLFRLFRPRGVPWIVSALMSSLIFGYAYHQFVYNNNFFLMTMAFVGGLIYCFALQWTHSFDVATFLHVIQNARLPSTQNILGTLTLKQILAILTMRVT